MNHPVRVPALRRAQAFVFDYFLILGYLGVLGAVGLLLSLGPLGSIWTDLVSTPVRTDLLAFLVTVVPVTVYFAWSEASEWGATWGKRRVGLRVVDVSGAPLGRGQALGRSALKFIPWQMAHTAMVHIPGFPMAPGEPPTWTLVLLAMMWLIVGVYLVGLLGIAGGRTMYDRLSGSWVVSDSQHVRKARLSEGLP